MSSLLMHMAAAGVVPTPSDPYFRDTVLLIHADGTNGGQNNTFLDSSANNFSISRNGNTTQGSFSPYGSMWSNYFDGSGDSIVTASNSALAFGTGDFSIECWAYVVSANFIISNLTALSSPGDYGTAIRWNSGNIQGWLKSDNANELIITSSVTASANTWNHIALVRTGTTLSLYLNGTRVATGSASITSLTDRIRIGGTYVGSGGDLNGHVSNLRVCKGSTPYSASSSTITVPTSALTAVTGTSLLTCQSNRFVDNSANAITLTVNGDTRVTNIAPLPAGSPYSGSANGGSAYFDGGGDYLDSSFSAVNVGTGDFTYEAWVYRTGTPGFAGILCANQYSDGILFQYTGANNCDVYIAGNNVLGGTFQVTQNAWTHIAIVRQSGTAYLYRNGVLIRSASNSDNLSLSSFMVGASSHNTGEAFPGYISGVRFVRSAVYTSAFTPPATPPSAITNTSWLLNFTNASIFDNSMKNDMETLGNAQISTSIKKWGSGSLYTEGANSGSQVQPNRLDLPVSTNWTFGTGDFTVEFWAYRTTNFAADSAILCSENPTRNWLIQWNGSKFQMQSAYLGGYLDLTGNDAGSGTWYHCALVRSSGTLKFYLDGVEKSSNAFSYDMNVVSGLQIGSHKSSSSDGLYLDDIRITKGVARYTANFTPPTAAFPDR